MSDADEKDLIAAEYVLGTLSAEERIRVDAERLVDAVLNAAIEAWNQRFAPLLDAVEDVAPPSHVYDGLIAQLFPTPVTRLQPRSEPIDAAIAARFRRDLRRWRIGAAACAALAAALAVWIGIDHAERPAPQLVALLRQATATPLILVNVDPRSRAMLIRPIDAVAPEGKSLELWIIEPSLGPPRSLGVIGEQAKEESLAAFDRGIVTKALYAVTIEPKGGAPNGVPTGAPVWTGRLTALSP